MVKHIVNAVDMATGKATSIWEMRGKDSDDKPMDAPEGSTWISETDGTLHIFDGTQWNAIGV